MKIKCIKVTNYEKGTDERTSNGWYSVGNVYYVLGLSFNTNINNTNNANIYTIQQDEIGSPFSANALDFEIEDHSLPESFCIYFDSKRKIVTIQPRSWYDYKSKRENWRSFWDDLFDGEPAAVEFYRKEVAFIKGEK